MGPEHVCPDERSQSGIGTLIILIAAILIATIAVGVFFDVAGLLEGRTSSTSTDVSQQLEGRLEIVGVSGTVSGGTVGDVNATIKLASDSGVVDLRDVTIQWVSSTGAETLAWDGTNTTGPTFGITVYGSSEFVLDGETDRATLSIHPDDFGPPLEAGETASLTILTQSKTIYRLRVPDSLSARSSVAL